MELPQNWLEPIIRVQSLVDSGMKVIPQRYVKPPSERPKLDSGKTTPSINIPIVDIKGLGDAIVVCPETIRLISDACKEWGVFYVVNHGVSSNLMKRLREVWREFFHLTMEQKERYANSPSFMDGYGSHHAIEKDVPSDWRDYFFLGVLPKSIRRYDKWPAIPNSFRETVEEYTMEVKKLSKVLLDVLSMGLGLDMNYLEKAIGGEAAQTCMGVNFYPRCPQPELTLGLSPHCDLSSLTVLLDDDRVQGLQFRNGHAWVPIHHIPNAFVINIGDQIQVLSNGIYKSVEHRAVVNSEEERLSIVIVIYPEGDIPIAPAKELLTVDFPPLYRPITYNEYRRYRTLKGVEEKATTESFLKAK